MSAIVSTTVRPAAAKWPGASRVLTAYWEAIARYIVRRAAIKSLRELDDRSLRDIGLARSEIEAAVYGLVAGRNRARV